MLTTGQHVPGFWKLIYPWSVCVCMCVCMCVSVCPPLRLVITSGVMWHDMDPYYWLNKFYSICMAAILSIVTRHGLRIEVHHRNQPNKSKLALYKPLLHFYSHLKQLYISNKMERFSYKGGCGVLGCICIKAFRRKACLGYG